MGFEFVEDLVGGYRRALGALQLFLNLVVVAGATWVV